VPPDQHSDELCVIDSQTSLFFSRLHQHVGVILIVGTTTNGALLDEQFQAVVAGGTEIDLIFSTLAELLWQQGIRQ
jgi:hypothetical protein